MNRLKNVLKFTWLSRVLIVFLAGVLLLMTTACNPGSPRVSGEASYDTHRAQRADFDSTDPGKVGGMNQFNDSYRENRGTQAQAKRLVDNARANENKVNSVEDFARSYREGTPLNQRAKNLSEDVGDAAKNFGKDMGQLVDEGTSNLKRNTQNAVENASDRVDRAVNPS